MKKEFINTKKAVDLVFEDTLQNYKMLSGNEPIEIEEGLDEESLNYYLIKRYETSLEFKVKLYQYLEAASKLPIPTKDMVTYKLLQKEISSLKEDIDKNQKVLDTIESIKDKYLKYYVKHEVELTLANKRLALNVCNEFSNKFHA